MRPLRFILPLLLLLWQQEVFSQFRMSLDIGSGLGINPSLSLLDKEIGRRNASVTHVDYTFHFPLAKRFDLSFGLGGKYIINHALLNESKVKTSTLRSVALLQLHYSVSDKLKFGVGVSGQNNRDYNDIFQFQPFNYRFNAELSAAYSLRPSIEAIVRVSSSMKRFTDAYLLNDPLLMVSVGFRFVVFKKNRDEVE